MAKIDIIGTEIDIVDMTLACATIRQWIENGEHHFITVANVHTVTEATYNNALHQAHKGAGMVVPDGRPLVWTGQRFGAADISQVRGTDLMLEVCRQSISAGWSHYFYGSTEDVMSGMVAEIRQRFPGIQIAGIECPPFRPLTGEEEAAAIGRINQSGANLLWIGLGAPKQEIWMAENIGRLHANAVIGVGAAFDFVAGTKSEAPKWMQRVGLEWFHRLADEPGRLWKRYLVTNSTFIAKVIVQWLRGSHLRK